VIILEFPDLCPPGSGREGIRATADISCRDQGTFRGSIGGKERVVAVFVIERRYAEAVDLSEEGVREINLINDEEDVRWLYSFLSLDRRKTYCLYEASSVDAVRRAAVRAGLPADVVVEVCGKVLSDGSLNPV
jgi:hypothetical protein